MTNKTTSAILIDKKTNQRNQTNMNDDIKFILYVMEATLDTKEGKIFNYNDIDVSYSDGVLMINSERPIFTTELLITLSEQYYFKISKVTSKQLTVKTLARIIN